MTEQSLSPTVRIRLTRGPIVSGDSMSLSASQRTNSGAVVTFRGCVRDSETDESETTRPILGLKYEIYEPMTSRELLCLAKEYATTHGVIAVEVEHSYDFVANGECSFVLQVAARHRREAIIFMDEFISAMKRHVPIWKVHHWHATDRES
ncbi:MAG: molybdenum cofactor biosynthesis protein MoaE [Rhodopirellula sp. JB053]